MRNRLFIIDTGAMTEGAEGVATLEATLEAANKRQHTRQPVPTRDQLVQVEASE